MIHQIYKQANERPAPFVDHTGILRDARTGEPIMPVIGPDDEDEGEGEDLSKSEIELEIYSKDWLAGYSFFDAGGVEALNRGKIRAPYGKHELLQT